MNFDIASINKVLYASKHVRQNNVVDNLFHQHVNSDDIVPRTTLKEERSVDELAK